MTQKVNLLTPEGKMAAAKERLIDELRAGGIASEKVLEAIRSVPREAFVPAPFQRDTYANRALPIGEGQTISQPYVVAMMTYAAHVEPQHKVLEIGTGSGYQAAILCKLVRRLFTIERFDSLRAKAERTLHGIGIYNFSGKLGDGSKGWAEQAPFDRIVVTAASPQVPQSLLKQLAPNGILVIPVGATDAEQKLMRYVKNAQGEISEQCLGPVKFVPLVGEEGAAAPSSSQTIAGRLAQQNMRGMK